MADKPYIFFSEREKKYFEWLDSLSEKTFWNVFVEEWCKMRSLFGIEDNKIIEEGGN